jgi:hypothetical protein
MTIHTLLVSIAEDSPIQRLPRSSISKSYRNIVLHPQERIIMKHLQFEYHLIVGEVVVIVEVLIEGAELGIVRN